ncbi:hypothetical protein M8J77_012682 [Diaphorina citri]|nr:hypothetical protein M8J77_012682 [Diaphorina citri]
MLMKHKKYFSRPVPVVSNSQVVAARVKIPAEDFEWNVHDDLNSSDHFPIVIKLRNYHYSAGQNSSRIIWKFKKANWIDYQNEITFHDDSGEITDVNECLRKINTNILQAANKTIPKLDLKKCKRFLWNKPDCVDFIELLQPSDPTLRSHFDSFSAPFPGSQPFSQESFIACKGFMDMDCHSDGIHCPTMLG